MRGSASTRVGIAGRTWTPTKAELVNMRNRPAPSPTDPISPDYYKVTLPDGTIVECRAMIRALGLNFALANVLKYLWRAGRKTPDREQDLRKAADYLADEIDHG
jgi:hypothetical protein